MQKVIGLVGLRGSGKDTAAQFLIEEGWQRIAFADKLYQEVADAFNVTIDFLANRETKELPLPELALCNCRDKAFLAVALTALGVDNIDLELQAARAPRSPRQIMQLWGTEYRRATVSDDYWRQKVAQVILNTPDKNFVVTDVRFPDEADQILSLNGTLARILRPSQAKSDDPALQHSSEVAMLNYPIATQFINNEGEAGLREFKSAVLSTFIS